MRKDRKASFDPKRFLAKVGDGKTIAKYQKDQIIFSQGEVADAVFYVQEGKAQGHGDFRAGKGSRGRYLGTR